MEIVSIGRGIDPDLIVKLPDGRHFPIALTGTDHALPSQTEPLTVTGHRLDIEGLRQIRRQLDELARLPRDGPASSAPS